ncbi:MAG: tetratricopeptide repeat protein [Promethearchaeota archaeon]
MSYPEAEELIQATKLIAAGKLNKAQEILKDIEEKSGQSPQNIIISHLLKCELLSERGLYEEGIKIAEHTYNMSLELGLNLLALDALLTWAFLLLCLGKPDQSSEITEKAELLFKSLVNELPADNKQRESSLALLKGWIYHQRGDIESAINHFELSLSLREKFEFKNEFSLYGNRHELALYGIAWAYYSEGKYNRALKYSEQGIGIAEEKGHISDKLSFLFIMANVYSFKWELDKSIMYAEKCMKICKQLDNKILAARVLEVLGWNYKMKGDLNRSIEIYEEGLEIFKESDHILLISLILNNLASCYKMKGELDQALKFIEQAIVLSNEINHTYRISSNLSFLIQILISKGDLERAQNSLQEFEHINNQIKNRDINHMYLLDKALLLKTSSRAINRGKAEEILKQILETENLNSEIYMEALLNLSELLITDLQISDESEILEEIHLLITKLLDLSEKSRSYWVLGESYLLNAKLALIQLRLNEARKLLTQGQKVAEKYGMTLLARKISHEHDELLKRLDMWENLRESKISMSERIKLSQLNEQMENVVSKRMIKVPELSDEEPILLLIVSEGGTPLFSQSFIEDKSYEDHLFGGFLSAVNTFMDEMFSEELDRATFGEHTLLMRSISPFFLCYIYKGQSYSAQNRINSFINEIQRNKEVWSTFEKYYQMNREIQLKDIPPLDPIIKEVFIDRTLVT